MAVGFSNTNKPLNPRGQDASPKGYNRASLFSGKALDFDGANDYVSTSLALTSNEVSVSFYLKWDDVGTQNIGFICEGSANDKMMIHTGASGAGVNGLQIAINVANYSVPQIISEGWNHYLITSDRINLNIYKNGVLFNSRTTDAGAIDITALTLGVRPIGLAYDLDGQLSNFKIFNTALTAEQVADLYNNPEKVVPTGVESNLKLWLPMMEGAGTTAYDGSGNGNHGTISGATYVNGIGAPSPQSAVMDWNKNKNSITNSADFSAAAGWTILNSGGTISVDNGYAESPYGGQTAARLQAAKGTNYALISFTPAVSTSGTYVSSVWVKSNTGSTQNVAMYSRNNLTDYQSVTTEWTRIEFTGSGSSNYFNIGSFGTSDASVDILLWGAQMVLDASEAGPYVPTFGTPQTSEVLLPQGLTTGRDITGVNLFENVRKQGALNLDGNSWAEVHDNASLDMASEISIEAWVYKRPDTSGFKQIINKIAKSGGTDYYGIWVNNASNGFLFESSTGGATNSNNGLSATDWNHLVVTYDGTSVRFYIDGALNKTAARSVDLSNDFHLLIGGGRAGQYYSNPIAQPRIYNRALTASEVLRNYNSGKNTYTND